MKTAHSIVDGICQLITKLTSGTSIPRPATLEVTISKCLLR